MKLAFLILAHKNPGQVGLLTDYLLKHDCDVFIHIDVKEQAVFGDFINKFKGRERLRIYAKYKVYWGSFNQIRATFFLLGEACHKVQFDFVSLISGQDLPIKPIAEFKEYLATRINKSFMQFYPVPARDRWNGDGGLDRMRFYWVSHFPKRLGFIFNRLINLTHSFQRRTKFYRKINLPLYGGANWFTLNHKTAAYVVEYIKKNSGFFRRFKFTRCADEIILQTILMNSEFKSSIVNDPLRYIDWDSGPEYPRTFRIEDTKRLLEDPNFFARKFDLDFDPEVVHKIYSKI
jgi:hypothetical protein